MQKKSSNPSEAGNLNLDSAEKINRIRDLIFGPQSRDYEQKFERQRQEISRVTQELNRTQEMIRSLEKTLSAQLKTLGEELSAKGEEQNKRQTRLLSELDQRLTEQIQSIDQHYRSEVERLSEALQQSEESLAAEMRTTTERLHNQKADRVALGDLLMNIGETLKSHDSAEVVNGLLQELADTIDEA